MKFSTKKMGVNFFPAKKTKPGGGVRGRFGKRPYFCRIFFCAPFPYYKSFQRFHKGWCEYTCHEVFLPSTTLLICHRLSLHFHLFSKNQVDQVVHKMIRPQPYDCKCAQCSPGSFSGDTPPKDPTFKQSNKDKQFWVFVCNNTLSRHWALGDSFHCWKTALSAVPTPWCTPLIKSSHLI